MHSVALMAVALAGLATVSRAQEGAKPRPMPRGVVVQAATERFAVSGATIEEITQGLRRALSAEGGFLGHYGVSWRYSYQIGDNVSSKAGCRLANVRVDMQTRVRVPDWKTSAEAAPEVAAAWSNFTASLENHIREHENIAIRTAGDFVQKLERMSDLSCRTLSQDVQREARSATDRLQERHRKFDVDTKEGTQAGARWPPS